MSNTLNRFQIKSTHSVAAVLIAAMLIPGCSLASAESSNGQWLLASSQNSTSATSSSDAVILNWNQHWTLKADGTMHRRDSKKIKLLNRRPIRQLADPRIDFVNGEDNLIIHNAQTTTADGTVLKVPDYSFNRTAPDDVAGWPEYSNWQQEVVSFSGVESGCVLELDYEVVSPPGATPWLDVDLQLDNTYPIVSRVITVEVPSNATLRHVIDRGNNVQFHQPTQNTYRWTISDMPAHIGEPQSPPWYKRTGRLRFTSSKSTSNWLEDLVNPVIMAASKGSDAIKVFVEKTAEEESDPTHRVKSVVKNLTKTFNIVQSYKTLRGLSCRPAKTIFQTNYGNHLEAASLYIAAIRALGFDAKAAVAVDSARWNNAAPTLSAVTGVVVIANVAGETIHIHPSTGIFENPGSWHSHLLLTNEDGSVNKVHVAGRGEKNTSELVVTGKLAVDKDANATGELRIRLTGGFYDPLKLETGDQQKALMNDIVNRVVKGFNVSSYSVTTLSTESLRANIQISTEGAIGSFANRHVIQLGDGPAFVQTQPLPLKGATRETSVALRGPIRELIELNVELPDGWGTSVVPASYKSTVSQWGYAQQDVVAKDNKLQFKRSVAITESVLSAKEFLEARRALLALSTDQAIIFAFNKTS